MLTGDHRVGSVKSRFQANEVAIGMVIPQAALEIMRMRLTPPAYSRAVSVAAGLSLLAGSACTRFGVLNAGLEAVKNPETTIGPQKRRAEKRRREQGLDHDVVSPD